MLIRAFNPAASAFFREWKHCNGIIFFRQKREREFVCREAGVDSKDPSSVAVIGLTTETNRNVLIIVAIYK